LQLDPDALGRTKTFIRAFMLDESSDQKTFAQLRVIYELDRYQIQSDPSDDLRIGRFVKDMADGRWREDIVILRKDGLVVDGVHRGVAFLQCVADGVEIARLPKIVVRDL
jgi:hypothetical protein